MLPEKNKESQKDSWLRTDAKWLILLSVVGTIVAILAALNQFGILPSLKNQGSSSSLGSNSKPTPLGSVSTATPYPPTITVGPGTPTPTPYPSIGNPPYHGGGTLPTITPEPSPTITPTSIPATSWPYTGTPYFSDSLTVDDGLWYITTNNDPNYSCKFVSGGGYQAYGNMYVGVPCYLKNQQWSNVAFEADFAFVSGGATRGAALSFDDDTNGNFYVFALEANGNYILRIYHGTNAVKPDPISGHIAYNSSQANTLGVILKDHIIKLYLNGKLITSYNDSSLNQGYVSVESYSESGQASTVSFTNARIWNP